MVKKSERNNQSGITLIALVITIVILIILATISINYIFGDNGLIKKAEQARDFQTNAEKETDKFLNDAESYIDEVIGNYDSNKGIEIKINVISEQADVSADGTIVKEVRDGNIPIPTGFYYVGGDINTGVVISDVEGDDLENSAGGNQFVWIPINVNQRIEIEVESINDLKSVLINGKDQEVEGKSFKTTIDNPRLNGLYIVEATDTNENTNVLGKELRSFYGQDFSVPWKYPSVRSYNTLDEMIKAEIDPSMTVEQFNTLLDFLGQTLEEYCLSGGITIKNEGIEFSREELILYWQDKYVNEFKLTDETFESVEKYGGFYVGRFEAGTEENRVAQDDELTPAMVKKGKYPYAYVRSSQAEELANVMYDTQSVKSYLITGCAWDSMINYISQHNNMGYDWAYATSDEYGNLGTNSRTKTGEYIKDCYYNIYDIVGNVMEWNSGEVANWMDATNLYSIRGGDYSTSYSYAAYRIQGDRSEDYLGFRVQLCLK